MLYFSGPFVLKHAGWELAPGTGVPRAPGAFIWAPDSGREVPLHCIHGGESRLCVSVRMFRSEIVITLEMS